MKCYVCGLPATRSIHCPTCDTPVFGCAVHDPGAHPCSVPMDGVIATAVTDSSLPIAFPFSPSGGAATLARGDDNQLKAPRNRITFISYNLQNFTGDHRMGRSNGSIDSHANQVRARFIAALMHATQAQGLLTMETGSDVSAAMEAVRRHAGDDFEPFVSQRTHMTPEIKTSHELAFTFRLRGVWHFRNLLPVFGVIPGEPRKVEDGTAMAFMRDLRSLDFDLPVMNPIGWFETRARVAARDTSLLHLARGLLAWGAFDRFEVLLELIEALRYLRHSAMQARNDTVFHATEQLELLHLIRFYESRPFDAKQLDVLKRCGPEQGGFEHQRNLPLSLFILLACKKVVITRHADELIHDEADATMVYDALAYFGCVEFHFETYGVLFRRDIVDKGKLLADLRHFEVMRFTEEGKLLGTQQPGSSTNWRSALRMVVPLCGGKWLEMLLFHTRFTVDKADLVHYTPRRRGRGRKKPQGPSILEQTYAIRARGVEEVARHITGDRGYGLPIMYCGDFNLPMTARSEALAGFAAGMESMVFTRYPMGTPATTLRAIPSLIESDGTQASYSQAYDAVYAHGLDSSHIACAALTLDMMFKLVDPEVIALLMPAVARYYQAQVAELRRRLALRFERLASIPGTASQRWQRVVAKSRLLQSWQWFDFTVYTEAARFNGSAIFQNSIVLKPLLTNAAADLKEALASAEQYADLSRLVYWLKELCDDLGHAAKVIGTLESSAGTRFAVGYESWISDHLPLLTIVDLDLPVTPPPFFNATSSTAPSSASPPPVSPVSVFDLSVPSVPENAEDYLQQQGAPGAVQRYREFLAAHGFTEGTATSDSNMCLLDTLGQHIYNCASPQAAQRVKNDLWIIPGSTLAIGDAPFPGYLQGRNFMVRLWMLGRDGSVGPPINIGSDSPTAQVIHVLHYGAHYVPLWEQ